MSLTSGGPKMQQFIKKEQYGYAYDMKGARLDNIVCFKCGQHGHFANRCTKGQFAFLTSKQNSQNQQLNLQDQQSMNQ